MSIDLCFRNNKFDKHGNLIDPFVEFYVWSEDKVAIESILNQSFVAKDYTLEHHTMRYYIRIPYALVEHKADFAGMLKALYDLQGG